MEERHVPTPSELGFTQIEWADLASDLLISREFVRLLNNDGDLCQYHKKRVAYLETVLGLIDPPPDGSV